MPIDLKSGQYAKNVLSASLLENHDIGILNNGGYHLFFDLDTSSRYNLILKSDYYIYYQNDIDLENFDYDERVNPNFENLLNGNVNHDKKFKRSDRTVSIFLNYQISLNEFIKKENLVESFLIKHVTIYPSKKTDLKIILTRLISEVADGFTNISSENYEVPVQDAQVSIEKKVNNNNPNLNTIVINTDVINKNIYEFSNLDPYTVSSPILDSKTILGNRKYVKFDAIPNTDADVEINLNIQKNSNKVIIPKLRLEKSMTTIINILIID